LDGGSDVHAVGGFLKPEWRVIALDQRGHGYSDHACSYTRSDYVSDLAALYDHLEIRRAILLGNSLGGVNAYQFAARHPDRVQALIIEDIGVVLKDEVSFVLKWKGTFERREEMLQSQRCLLGDYWSDWLATACPALLIRGV
jgi:esterase